MPASRYTYNIHMYAYKYGASHQVLVARPVHQLTVVCCSYLLCFFHIVQQAYNSIIILTDCLTFTSGQRHQSHRYSTGPIYRFLHTRYIDGRWEYIYCLRFAMPY